MVEVGGVLVLPRPGLRTLREHVEAAWPQEACGLLEGYVTGRIVRVRRVLPCRNEHEHPHRRYRIDPETFLRADRAAERRSRRVVGTWHSHPHGGAYFSDTDRHEAWPGWSYLVAGVTNGGMRDLRAWSIEAEPVEQRVEVS